MTVILGNSPGAAPGGYVDTARKDNARLVGPAPQHLWAYAIRLFGGKPGGGANQEIIAAAWARDRATGDPAAIRGKSLPLTVTTGFDGINAGQSITATINETGVGDVAATAFRVPSGTYIYVGYHDRTGAFRIGLNPNGTPVDFVEGTGALQDPSNPFALVSHRSDLRAVSLALLCQENRAPNEPTNLTPAAGAEVLGPTPLFEATFADWDSVYGDVIQVYQVQVMRGATLIWNREYDSSNTERAASRFSRPYEGSALIAGETLQWRCRVADNFTTYGLWSNQTLDSAGRVVENAWTTLYVRGAGSAPVTGLTSLVAGKITNLSPAVNGTYAHANGLAMNGVQVRVFQNGVLVRGPSVVIARTVAPGGTWSVTWAETGFAALSPGNRYEFQARARDTGNAFGVWVPVPGLFAATNALPTTPSQLQPTGNIAVSAPPAVTFVMTDVDDTVAGGLNAEVEVTRPNATVVIIAAPVVSEAAGTWRVQLSATQLSAYGTYTLRARGKDATSTGAWSAPSTFRYIQGPTLTVSAPVEGSTLATNQPVTTWTPLATQVSFQITYFLLIGSTLVHDSGVIASTTVGSYIPPSGVLHDGVGYIETITVTQADGLAGYVVRTFTVDYPTPDVLTNVVVSEYSTELDREEPSAVLLSWDAPVVSTAIFWQYVVEREEYGKPLTKRILTQMPSISATRYVDHEAASGVPYLYRVWWEEIQGTDIRPSVVAELLATIDLRSTIIHRVEAPEVARLHLRYYDDRPITSEPDYSFVPTWSGATPTAIGRPSESVTFSLRTRLVPLAGEPDPKETLAQLDAIVYQDDPVLGRRPRSETICVRTPLGDLIYGVITRVRREPDPKLSGYTLDIDIQATNYRRPLTTGE